MLDEIHYYFSFSKDGKQAALFAHGSATSRPSPLPSRTGFMNHMIKNSCSAAQLLPTYCMMLVGRYGPLHNSTKLNELMNRAWRSAARNYGLHPFSGRLYANAPTARFIVLVRQLGTDFPAFLIVRRGKIEWNSFHMFDCVWADGKALWRNPRVHIGVCM